MLGTEKILLVKPQTFMNSSGLALQEIAHWYKLKPEDFFVIYDDMDIPVGNIRIRKKGSSGGHNGIKSIISALHGDNFIHMRIGINRPLRMSIVDYVLAHIPAEEKTEIDVAIKNMLKAIQCAVTDNVDMAMNKYNKTSSSK